MNPKRSGSNVGSVGRERPFTLMPCPPREGHISQLESAGLMPVIGQGFLQRDIGAMGLMPVFDERTGELTLMWTQRTERKRWRDQESQDQHDRSPGLSTRHKLASSQGPPQAQGASLTGN